MANKKAKKKTAKKKTATAQTWWMSWNEYEVKDYRPLRDPPNDGILGWWCTGEAGDGSFVTLVAWVRAASRRAANRAVETDWPARKSGRDWRFARACEPGFRPSDRFPLDRFPLARAESGN